MSGVDISAPWPATLRLSRGLWALAIGAYGAGIYADFFMDPGPGWQRFALPLSFTLAALAMHVDPRARRPDHGDTLEEPEAHKSIPTWLVVPLAFMPLMLEVASALTEGAEGQRPWWSYYVLPAVALIFGTAVLLTSRRDAELFWERGWAMFFILFAVLYLVVAGLPA